MVGNLEQIKNYFNISGGKIVRSYGKNEPDNVPNCVSRINKNGDTVYEVRNDFIEGKIEKAEVVSHESFGDSIKLTIEKNGVKGLLSIKFDSAYGRYFLFKINSINLDEEVRIIPYSFQSKEGNNVVGLNVFQNGVKIKNEHTRENPNGLPPLKEVVFNGNKHWDKTDQLSFLKTKFDFFSQKINLDPVINAPVQSYEEVSNDSLNDLDF